VARLPILSTVERDCLRRYVGALLGIAGEWIDGGARCSTALVVEAS
jgi:hypothetical protein